MSEKVARQLSEDKEGAVGYTSFLVCILNTTAPELNQTLILKGRWFPCQLRKIHTYEFLSCLRPDLFSFPHNLFTAAVNAE